MPLFHLYVQSQSPEPRFHNLQNVMHTEMTVSVMFSLLAPLPLGPSILYNLSVSLKNYTVNMASPAALSLLFSARCSFGRFPSERSLHSYLKVMEPACVRKARWKTTDTAPILFSHFNGILGLEDVKWLAIYLCLYMEIHMVIQTIVRCCS